MGRRPHRSADNRGDDHQRDDRPRDRLPPPRLPARALSFSRSGFLVCWKLFQLKVRRWLQVLGAAVRFEEDVVVALLECANKDLLLEQVSRTAAAVGWTHLALGPRR
jgi:hypothetical protein